MESPNKMSQLFSAYIGTRKVLIADTSTASRTGLAKTLLSLGAKMQNLTIASSFDTAVQAIKNTKPEVVICDYDLDRQCGLNLLQNQRLENKQGGDSVFILVTANTSQSAVAQAAEEDVDMFVLKPYTLETLRNSIMKAALTKVHPNDYQKKIDEGKKILEGGNIDGAIPVFEEAIKLHPRPALAYYYRGHSQHLKKAKDAAESDYIKGLECNKIHYKCLAGLFDLLLEDNKHKDAYEVAKRISRYFPANPLRLTQVLRLAIVTKSYEDIERYYQAFVKIDTRNDELIRYVCAALVVCGKFYLQQNSHARALELFEKAGITAAGRAKVIREIVTALTDYRLAKEAEAFLSRFPDTAEGQSERKIMELTIAGLNGSSQSVVQMGRDLIQKKIEDPVVYKLLIKHSMTLGFKESADHLAQEAAKKWPNEKALFDELTQTLTSPTLKAG